MQKRLTRRNPDGEIAVSDLPTALEKLAEAELQARSAAQ